MSGEVEVRRSNGSAPAEGPGLEVLTARQICELPDPPTTDELLGSLVVRRQRLMLCAATGEGKTTIALQIVRVVTEGGEFLEWESTGGERALVVDAEQGTRTVKRRLQEAGLDHSDAVDVVRAPGGLALDSSPEDIANLEQQLASGSYSIVLLDPLYKLHSGDSNVERAAVDLMRRLDHWRDAFGFALVLPVHLRKPIPGERFSIHDVFGSSGYTRGAEVVLGLRRVSNGFGELHFFKDRDGDLEVGQKWGLLFDREHGFRRAPDAAGESKSEKVERLLEYVRLHPGESTTKVTTEVVGRKKTLARLLHADDRFRSERHGPADCWFAADPDDPFPAVGTGAERVAQAEDERPVPEAHHPLKGVPTGTGESVVGPDDEEREPLRLVEGLEWR